MGRKILTKYRQYKFKPGFGLDGLVIKAGACIPLRGRGWLIYTPDIESAALLAAAKPENVWIVVKIQGFDGKAPSIGRIVHADPTAGYLSMDGVIAEIKAKIIGDLLARYPEPIHKKGDVGVEVEDVPDEPGLIDAWLSGECDLLPDGENCMAMSAAALETEIRNSDRSPEERMFLAGVLHAKTYETAATAALGEV